jgi:hypothetical protein
MADPLPPNIQEFNAITGVIFALLYVAHPMPKDLDAEEIASTLGLSPSASMPSGRSFNDVFESTARWLHEMRYIQAYGGNARERAVLTDKALAAMNVVPPTLGRSRGSELAAATKEAKSVSGWAKLVELAGTLIGSVIKTMIE